jgi:rhodanese-related sulfurtransferase
VAEQRLEITPQEAKAKLAASSQTARLIDVREPEEFELARIDGSELISMQNIPCELQRIESLADDSDLLLICHHGVRSLQVAEWLRRQGVENCFSVAGGIDQWSREIDSTVPRY